MCRWHNVLRLYPENEVEKLTGWCVRKTAYVKVKKKAGYKNPLLYNGVVCLLKEYETYTSVRCIRIYGLMNIPEVFYQWLCIFSFLMLVKPEQITLGQVFWISNLITVLVSSITAIYSCFSSAGKHERLLINSFLEQIFSKGRMQ